MSQADRPMREVVHIIEREGTHGGALWWLVLECGHSVSRRRVVSKNRPAAMFEPIERRLAPKHALCLYCQSGAARQDPAILIKALRCREAT